MEQSNSVNNNQSENSSEQSQYIHPIPQQNQNAVSAEHIKTSFWKSDTFFVITFFLFGPLSFLWAPKEITDPQVTITRPSPLKLLMAVFLSFAIPSLFTYLAYSNIDIWETTPNAAALFLVWIFIFLFVGLISCFTLFPEIGKFLRRNRIIFVIVLSLSAFIASIALDFIVKIFASYEDALPSVINDNLAIILMAIMSIAGVITYFKAQMDPIHQKIFGTLVVITVLLTIAALPLFLMIGPTFTKMYGPQVKKQGDRVHVIETRIGYTIDLYPADNYWQSREPGKYSRVFSKNGYSLTIEKAQTETTTLEAFVDEEIQKIKQQTEYDRILKKGNFCNQQPQFQENIKNANWQGIHLILTDCFDMGDIKAYLKHNENFYIVSLNYSLSYANHLNKDANRQKALNNFNLMLSSLKFQ